MISRIEFLKLVSDQLNLSQPLTSTHAVKLSDLELDSLELIQLVMVLEEEHKLTIDLDTIESHFPLEVLYTSLKSTVDT